jgi:site-specific recombinase XerD
VATSRASVRGPSVLELAEDWLTAKRVMESASQASKGHSDRARRGDLARWGALLTEATGRGRADGDGFELLARVRVQDLSTENVSSAVAAAKARFADATVARMVSHLRGFTRWAYRSDHLRVDPCDDELLRTRRQEQRRPRAVTDDDVRRLADTAATPPPRGRMWWPARDIALVQFMATTGARAEEVCGVLVGDIDRRAERPIWRVSKAKGGRQRDIPLSRSTAAALDAWLIERITSVEDRQALAAWRRDALFVRVDGRPLTVNVLDRLIRQLAARADVSLPPHAAAHSLRHHYGVTLALRGVPQSVIAQLMGHADPRTTAIYTTVASRQLIGVLDDAGLL